MMDTLMKAMRTSISEILEKMFFMPLEFDDKLSIKESELDSKKTLACRLDFKGSFSGYFILWLPEKILLEMTQNFMGIKTDEITKDHLHGTIKELINMMAGNTFSNYDEEAEFLLNIPELIKPAQTSPFDPNIDKEYTVLTQTTEGCLALKLIIH